MSKRCMEIISVDVLDVYAVRKEKLGSQLRMQQGQESSLPKLKSIFLAVLTTSNAQEMPSAT